MLAVEADLQDIQLTAGVKEVSKQVDISSGLVTYPLSRMSRIRFCVHACTSLPLHFFRRGALGCKGPDKRVDSLILERLS